MLLRLRFELLRVLGRKAKCDGCGYSFQRFLRLLWLSSLLPPPLSKDDDGRWKRGGRLRVPEADPAANETNLAFDREILPPSRVCPGGHQANYDRALLRRFVGFFHPITDFSPVGRVHPTGSGPLLQQPVLLGRKVPIALRVLGKRANIELEMEFTIKLVKDELRSRPLVTPTRKQGSVHGHGFCGSIAV